MREQMCAVGSNRIDLFVCLFIEKSDLVVERRKATNHFSEFERLIRWMKRRRVRLLSRLANSDSSFKANLNCRWRLARSLTSLVRLADGCRDCWSRVDERCRWSTDSFVDRMCPKNYLRTSSSIKINELFDVNVRVGLSSTLSVGPERKTHYEVRSSKEDKWSFLLFSSIEGKNESNIRSHFYHLFFLQPTTMTTKHFSCLVSIYHVSCLSSLPTERQNTIGDH